MVPSESVPLSQMSVDLMFASVWICIWYTTPRPSALWRSISIEKKKRITNWTLDWIYSVFAFCPSSVAKCMYAQTVIVLTKHRPSVQYFARLITDHTIWRFDSISFCHYSYRHQRAVISEFQLCEFCTENNLQSQAASRHVFKLLMSKVLASVLCVFQTMGNMHMMNVSILPNL